MKKRILALALVIVLVFALCVPASAASGTETVDITYRAIKIVLNGEEITPCDAEGKTVEPFIMNSNGTTYLPLRAIGQALGLGVAWDGPTSTVTLTSGGNVITGAGEAGSTKGGATVDITYRDIKVVLDGQPLELKNAAGATVEPFIMGGTTYLPLRVVSEALNLDVKWDSAANTVQLFAKEKLYDVIRVVDGDTIVVNYNGTEEKVRMIGIDTPESVHPDADKNTAAGVTASEYTKSMLEGKKVSLEFDVQQRDTYGRLLAYVYLDGVMFNKTLLEKGYAVLSTYPPNVKYVDEFTAIVDSLKGSEPDEPENETESIVYITPTGKRYHILKGCAGKNAIETTYEAAVAKGYTPCKTCVG